VGVHHIITCTFPSGYFSSLFLICSYVPNIVLVIIDVQPKELGIPKLWKRLSYAFEFLKKLANG
jgi:hypothetical protein